MAAQSTGLFSGSQTTDSNSSETNVPEEQVNSVEVAQTYSIKNAADPETNIDSGRARSPILNTGKSRGQSSVANSLPKAEVKQEEQQPKRLPWEQQSAENEVKAPESSDNTVSNADSPLPWQQQSSAKVKSTNNTENTANTVDNQKTSWAQQSASQTGTEDLPPIDSVSTTDGSSETKIRRVIIDPVTGLYIATSLSNINNPANESNSMSFENRQEDLLEWPFWEMGGRIGLTVAKDSYNGSVAWDQNGEAIDFRFRGPLGIGGVRIHGNLDEQVRVKTTTGEDFTVQDFETEMQARMGWSIPINSLRYWTLGIVDPAEDADVVLNGEDLLDELVQGDWKVVFETYREVDGVQLPRKFKITGPDTRIKMIVNDWTIPSAE